MPKPRLPFPQRPNEQEPMLTNEERLAILVDQLRDAARAIVEQVDVMEGENCISFDAIGTIGWDAMISDLETVATDLTDLLFFNDLAKADDEDDDYDDDDDNLALELPEEVISEIDTTDTIDTDVPPEPVLVAEAHVKPKIED